MSDVGGGSSWPREAGVSKSGGRTKSSEHLGNSGALHRGNSSTRRTLSKRVPGPCACACARTHACAHGVSLMCRVGGLLWALELFLREPDLDT